MDMPKKGLCVKNYLYILLNLGDLNFFLAKNKTLHHITFKELLFGVQVSVSWPSSKTE